MTKHSRISLSTHTHTHTHAHTHKTLNDCREWALCVGRGFDWLNVPNVGLIISPYRHTRARSEREREREREREKHTHACSPSHPCPRSQTAFGLTHTHAHTRTHTHTFTHTQSRHCRPHPQGRRHPHGDPFYYVIKATIYFIMLLVDAVLQRTIQP